jgi:hypothetical protein
MDEKILVGLGRSKSPMEIIRILTSSSRVRINDLQFKDTCKTLNLGKMLGSGRNGKVYALDDQENRGIFVVVKQISINDSWAEIEGWYVLDGAMNEIVMSAYFHSIYSDSKLYSINFPYCEGFFTCGNQANLVVEELSMTLDQYMVSGLYSDNKNIRTVPFQYNVFTNLISQLCFSLAMLRKKQLMHNDMHSFNLMITVVDNNKFYKGKSLGAEFFRYRIGNTIYRLKNSGVILKVVDLDFACKFSHPKICPSKVYGRKKDDWNISARFAESYDFITILTFLMTKIWIAYPKGSQYQSARTFLIKLVTYFMDQIRTPIIMTNSLSDLMKSKGISNWSNEDKKSYNTVKKFFSMVNHRTFRPLEKYATSTWGSEKSLFEFLVSMNCATNTNDLGLLFYGEL